MGTLNHLRRFIPDLHTHTVHFRASLKACIKQSFLWGDDQSKAFYDIIKLIAKIPSMYHFDSSKGSIVKCDASHNGLGACLEQEVDLRIWAPTAFASRFLNNAEVRYSTNKLELLAIVWAREHLRKYLLGTRFQVLTDHKAIISALSENYNNKSYQSRLARWADCLLPFDFEVIHAPGVTLGIVDYLSRYPTFPAPAPSKHDELFVVKSIEAFHLALSFINCYNSSPGHQNCETPQEGVQFVSQFNDACYLRHSPVEGVINVPQCLNQSSCGMHMDCSRCLSQDGVDLCAQEINQSGTGLLIDCCKPDGDSENHCLRPESLINSPLIQINFFNTKSNMTTPTINSQTHTDSNANITQPDSMTILQSTAEQAGLQTYVETFPISSPNFRRPSPRPNIRSCQLTRLSRLDQIRQHNRTRERAAKTRFVATRTVTRKDGHSQLLEAMRRCRLSKPGRKNMAAKIGVLAMKGVNLSSSSKKGIVGLPGLFDADLLAELTAEDCFLGPMKRAIVNKDITSFNKLGAYMAQFWPTAAVVNNCVAIDNKLAIPESLRQAVLTRLHRSHPGQEATMTASEYLWWPFMNRQIIETWEKCRECTLFGKNLKPASTFNSAKPLTVLSGPNQELQLDFAGPILDEKGSNIFLLVAIKRFFKFPSVLISKTTGAKKVTNFLDSYIRIHGLPRSIRTDHGSGFKNNLVQEFCSNRGIKHILSPVGDHRGSGLVERSIQTIKRKLGVAKLDPNFKNLKNTIHQILEDIRESNHSVLKKWPFELHFGRKPNTVWSQARNNVVQSDTSAQGLECNLLTPDQIASNDYSRDRAKVVPRGSSSPTIPTRFKPLFLLNGNVADSEPYKALAYLARAANKWSQFRRNLPPDAGKLVLKELTTRHSDLAHSLKSGLNSNTLRFSVIASPPGTQVKSRRAPIVQPTRLSRTSKLENLLLSDPGRVKVFRKIIDRQSGKPLYKLTKFKIVRVTDHTYITDK